MKLCKLAAACALVSACAASTLLAEGELVINDCQGKTLAINAADAGAKREVIFQVVDASRNPVQQTEVVLTNSSNSQQSVKGSKNSRVVFDNVQDGVWQACVKSPDAALIDKVTFKANDGADHELLAAVFAGGSGAAGLALGLADSAGGAGAPGIPAADATLTTPSAASQSPSRPAPGSEAYKPLIPIHPCEKGVNSLATANSKDDCFLYDEPPPLSPFF